MKILRNQKNGMSVNPYSRLVSLAVRSENVFHFPEGLPAFENVRQFVLVHKEQTTPFIYLQALEPGDLSFVCVDPFKIYPDYEPAIAPHDVDFLNLKSQEDLLLMSIVTVTRDVRNITMNLQGPVAINIKTRLGKQVICSDKEYPVRFKIWEALNNLEHRKTATAS